MTRPNSMTSSGHANFLWRHQLKILNRIISRTVHPIDLRFGTMHKSTKLHQVAVPCDVIKSRPLNCDVINPKFQIALSQELYIRFTWYLAWGIRVSSCITWLTPMTSSDHAHFLWGHRLKILNLIISELYIRLTWDLARGIRVSSFIKWPNLVTSSA